MMMMMIDDIRVKVTVMIDTHLARRASCPKRQKNGDTQHSLVDFAVSD